MSIDKENSVKSYEMETEIKQVEDEFRSKILGPVFRLVLCAGSGMGKTTFLADFLSQIDALSPSKFKKIVIHYRTFFNPLFQKMYVRDPTRIELTRNTEIKPNT